jgi:hypothetical protein
MFRQFVWGTVSLVAIAIATQTAFAEEARVRVTASGKTGAIEVLHGVTGELAADVQAGTIARARLIAELDRGVALLLREVPVKAQLSRGHFVGWQLQALFAKRSDVKVAVLQAGDIVLRVNGASIERPEAFKEIFDSLRTARELTIEIERAGQLSTLHYAIQ